MEEILSIARTPYHTVCEMLDRYNVWVAGAAVLWAHLKDEGNACTRVDQPSLELWTTDNVEFLYLASWFTSKPYTSNPVRSRPLAHQEYIDNYYRLNCDWDTKTIHIYLVNIPMEEVLRTKFEISVFAVARVPKTGKIFIANPTHITQRIYKYKEIESDACIASVFDVIMKRFGFTRVAGCVDPRQGLSDDDCYFAHMTASNIWTCEQELITRALLSSSMILVKCGQTWYVHPRAILGDYVRKTRGVGPLREIVTPIMSRKISDMAYTVYEFGGENPRATPFSAWHVQTQCKLGWRAQMMWARHDLC